MNGNIWMILCIFAAISDTTNDKEFAKNKQYDK